MPASSLTTSSPRVSERRVKHLRLFGSRLNSDCVASRWLLRQSGHDDDVEHVEVNVITSEHMTEAFSGRNRFQSLPYLEVIFDRCGAVPSGTTKVSDLAPWKDEAPCTTHTATGETIAEPDDRVFSLTEGGAVCMFFAEHFKLTNIWDPRRVLQRLRSVEISGHAELLARRIMSMVLIIVSSRTAGATTSDIVTGVAAHEPELLWTFRIMEDMLTRSEEAAAHAAGLDYQELLAVGESEVSDIEASESQPPAHVDKQGPRDTRHHRFPTSPTLVALDAYIGGRSLSIADFLVTSDLQVYPYIQSWLPNSLKQPRFPALLRYLERMRNVHGFEHALLPRLSFHNVFRRRPKVMASNQLLYVFAERLKKMINSSNGSTTTSSPSAKDAPMTGNAESDGTPQEETATPHQTKSKTKGASALKERLGRVRAWAPKLTGHAPPLPCTLCDEDERALQASQSHRSRNTVRLSSADAQSRLAKKMTTLPPTASSFEAAAPAVRSLTAQPRSRCAREHPQCEWPHDPYEHPTVPNTRMDGKVLSCRIPPTAALTPGRAHGTVMWRHDPYCAV